jgi:NAD(P)-dependent dehydrogenase (short-subunit alcohol dehydrogenase family)
MTLYYKDFNNKTAVITGGASGLGKGTAKVFAEHGANIVLVDIDSTKLDLVGNEIRQMGVKVSFYTCDVTNEKDVNKIVHLIEKQAGFIDILVNAAGVWASSGFEDSEYASLEDWDFTYSINVKGTVIFSESVAEKMKERNYGKIINIASHAGKYASPSNAAYGASKAAVIHLTQSLALRWASNNINVNVICPGSIWTPMWERIAKRIRRQNVSKNKMSTREIFLEHIKAVCPLQREQTPEDIGNAVVFFASENAKNITGQSLNVNGGIIMD